MRYCRFMRFYQSFPTAIPLYRVGYPRVTHPSATKIRKSKLSLVSVRLACVKHAASVHPEPGSNSHVKVCSFSELTPAYLVSFYLSVFLLCLGCNIIAYVTVQLVTISSDSHVLPCDEILGNFKVVMLFSYQGSVLFCTPFKQHSGARQQMVLYHPYF